MPLVVTRVPAPATNRAPAPFESSPMAPSPVVLTMVLGARTIWPPASANTACAPAPLVATVSGPALIVAPAPVACRPWAVEPAVVIRVVPPVRLAAPPGVTSTARASVPLVWMVRPAAVTLAAEVTSTPLALWPVVVIWALVRASLPPLSANAP